MLDSLVADQRALGEHPVFGQLKHLEALRRFMEIHVFAVWDFMSLVKALQREVTCVTVPWRPSKYPHEVVRLLNEIVLAEESDLDAAGHPTSHFALYLRAMREIGADTRAIEAFLVDLDVQRIPVGPREFVEFTLETVRDREPVEIAASFFFGRERVIPSMFESATRTLRQEAVPCETFLWYLERHIELDADSHGPAAARLIHRELDRNPFGLESARLAASEALHARHQLWDGTLETLRRIELRPAPSLQPIGVPA